MVSNTLVDTSSEIAHVPWFHCPIGMTAMKWSAATSRTRRVGIRWCERRTPSLVSGGAAYSISLRFLFSFLDILQFLYLIISMYSTTHLKFFHQQYGCNKDKLLVLSLLFLALLNYALIL